MYIIYYYGFILFYHINLNEYTYMYLIHASWFEHNHHMAIEHHDKNYYLNTIAIFNEITFE